MNKEQDVCQEKVFNAIYDEHGRSIWNFLYYKCGDSAQADDLVQEAFIKLWQNCAKVPFQKAKSFLYTVANNNFLNEVAHKKVVLKHARAKKSHVDNQSPEFLLEEKQYNLKIQNAIADLTEAQRTAFLLNRIDGKKYTEIAEILGISVKAVEKRMSQALARLRVTLKEIKI